MYSEKLLVPVTKMCGQWKFCTLSGYFGVAELLHFQDTRNITKCCIYNNKWCRPTRHEGIRRTRGTHPLILNMGTNWKWVVTFKSQPLYSLKLGPDYSCSCSGVTNDATLQSISEYDKHVVLWDSYHDFQKPDVIHYWRFLRLFVFRSDRVTIKLALVIKTSSSLAIRSSRVAELRCKQPLQVNKSTNTRSLRKDPGSYRAGSHRPVQLFLRREQSLSCWQSNPVLSLTTVPTALSRPLYFIMRVD
jgi:hypothetical protein